MSWWKTKLQFTLLVGWNCLTLMNTFTHFFQNSRFHIFNIQGLKMSLKIKIPKKVSATASFSTDWKMWTLWVRSNINISGTLEKPQPEPLIGNILVKKIATGGEVVMPCFRAVKGDVREWWNLQNRSSFDGHYLPLVRLEKNQTGSQVCSFFASFLYIFIQVLSCDMNETKNIYMVMFFRFCMAQLWFVTPCWLCTELLCPLE